MTYNFTVEQPRKSVHVTWDDKAKAAYIRFFQGKVSRTAELAPGMNADYSSGGRLLGLEILDPERLRPRVFHQVLKRLKADLPLNPAAIPELFAKA